MVQVALLGIVTVFMALLFKSGKSEYAVLISLTGCVLIFLLEWANERGLCMD